MSQDHYSMNNIHHPCFLSTALLLHRRIAYIYSSHTNVIPSAVYVNHTPSLSTFPSQCLPSPFKVYCSLSLSTVPCPCLSFTFYCHNIPCLCLPSLVNVSCLPSMSTIQCLCLASPLFVYRPSTNSIVYFCCFVFRPMSLSTVQCPCLVSPICVLIYLSISLDLTRAL